MSSYTITKDGAEGLFIVRNEISGKEYKVDITHPSCTCEAWYYSKVIDGRKVCKHISLCRQIKVSKD
jgi:predicted nucleic acid-binding Zn finger protein